MKKLILYFFVYTLWGLPYSGASQSITVDDDFGDGEITNNPAWSGDTGRFSVVDEAGNFRLCLSADSAGMARLSLPSTTAYGTWTFFVRFDFSPLSASNNLTVFLASDTGDLTGRVSGYALRAGRTGSDDRFEILRYQDGQPTGTVLKGRSKVNEGGAYQLKIERRYDGRWSLYGAPGYGSVPQWEAEGWDNTIRTAAYFGLLPQYTSNRRDKFFFDDIRITDSPLRVTGLEVVSNGEIQVHFTKPVDPGSVEPTDFIIDCGIGHPGATSTYGNSVLLSFDPPLPGNDYHMSVTGIADSTGTGVVPDTVGFSINDPFEPGDIVINEIMYDPPEGIPEYIELFNPTGKRFDIRGWLLGDANSISVLSRDTLVLHAGELMVICPDTTAMKALFGTAKYVLMSRFPALNNSPGDAVRIRTAEGVPVDSLYYSSRWGGDGVALERRSYGAESVFEENWKDSPDPLGGTPGAPNRVAADSLPPVVSGVVTEGRQSLLLTFSERLDEGPASDRASYSLSETIGIDEARFLEPDTVRLLLDAPLQNATGYTLSIREIADIFGNRIEPVQRSFIYYEPAVADYGDLFINEFMYDPPAGMTEYIELYNGSEKSLDLREWTLSDNTGSPKRLTFSRYIMPPGSYLVLAPDSTLSRIFPELALLAMASRFPSLNNGGDEIVLRRGDWAVLDSLEYEASWGGEGTALERRVTGVSAVYRENWGDSPHGWGSPGSVNAIGPDRTPPDLFKLQAASAGMLHLIFSERIDSGNIDLSHFIIHPFIEIKSIFVREDTVGLVLNRSMLSGTTYRVRVQKIDDLFGNRLDSDSLAVDYLVFSKARPGDVVINEFVYRPSPVAGAAFVELYNRSGSHFDLSGWKLGDAADQVILPESTRLEAGTFLVLTGSRDLAVSVENGTFLSRFASLDDSEDTIYIQNGDGLTIDSLSYTPGWGVQKGISMERKDPLAASNDPANWAVTANRSEISAGLQNRGYTPDLTPPQVIYSTLDGSGRIEVRFDEFVDPARGGKFLIKGVELAVEYFDPYKGNTLFLQNPAGVVGDGPLPDLTVRQLADVKGNRTATVSIPVSLPVEPGDVVINEIMYQPLDRNNDFLPNQGEYVELRNIRDHAVSMEGFFLHDAPDENNAVRSQRPESTVSRWIPANGILLVYADTSSTFAKSRIASYFGLGNNREIEHIRVEGMGLNLAVRNDAVYLSDRDGVTVDSVFYNDRWHNPNIVDTRGVALERILPGGPSNEPSNWGSSPVPTGGTPGLENRLYRDSGEPPGGFGISFDPNPFSPDGDGFEDHLIINYRLDRPGYLLTVRIFDRYGRHVRTLASGEPAGQTGSLAWDGRTDEGRNNRLGIYIVLFEAYDGASGRKMTFKELAVVSRKF